MRTLTGVSRLFLLAAIAVAALLVVGGAYFIGYVGQLERGLSGPRSAPERISAQLVIIEQALGHTEFLKSYRDYWTGDVQAQALLLKDAAISAQAASALAQLSAKDGAGADAVREIQAIVATFAQTAAAAPATPPSGLRGVNDDSVRALPGPAQLETSYLTLTTALERLRDGERASRTAALGSALDRALTIIVVAFAALICSLLAVAWIVRTSIIHPLNILERSLTAAAHGATTQRIWGTDRPDEIGELARAGEALRRGVTDKEPLNLTLAEQVKTAVGALQLAAAESVGRVGEVTARFRIGGDELTAIAARVNERIDAVLGGLSRQMQAANRPDAGQDHDALRAAVASDLKALAETINTAADRVRSEVSRLIEHVDEERLLPSRGGVKLLEGPSSPREGGKSLADVPKAVVLERLGDLAAEMHAVANPSQHAAETASSIEERARGLFTELGTAQDLGEDETPSLEIAAADIAALAGAVAKLELRAEALSEQAVARRFDDTGNTCGADLRESAFAADLRTDAAIQSVFESIERLNNVAAALARAGDAERQRRAMS